MIVFPIRTFVLLWMSSLNAAAAAEPATLTHNPFSRPPSTQLSPRDGDGERAPSPDRPFDVLATMVTNGKGMIDVDGRIYRPGDEIQGYTLITVFEDRAVFTNRGSRLTIFVRPQPEDESDE